MQKFPICIWDSVRYFPQGDFQSCEERCYPTSLFPTRIPVMVSLLGAGLLDYHEYVHTIVLDLEFNRGPKTSAPALSL